VVQPSSGAQTERRGEAGPVRILLGGGHAPAALTDARPRRRKWVATRRANSPLCP
jgi:hypothetical protein